MFDVFRATMGKGINLNKIMVRVKVHKIYTTKDEVLWVLVQNQTEGIKERAFLRIIAEVRQPFIGEELEVPLEFYNKYKFEYQNALISLPEESQPTSSIMFGEHGINSVIKFGLYKGYQLGIVYAFDSPYLEWCIKNIETFYINDLEQLQSFSVFSLNKKYNMTREIGWPDANPLIDMFSSIQELTRELGLANKKYCFKEEIAELNERKKQNLRVRYLSND